jgi:chromosome segregation ATPase
LDGKERTLARTDSTYTLKSNLDTVTAQKEAEKLSNDLAEALKPLDKELASIKAMKARLDEAKRQETDTDSLKTELQALDPDLYSKLGLALLNSPDELLSRLTTHENELTAKRTELQAQADKAREKLVREQKSKAEQKDRLKKEVLNFIHQIGFDVLPQATTDTIIRNINLTPNKY